MKKNSSMLFLLPLFLLVSCGRAGEVNPTAVPDTETQVQHAVSMYEEFLVGNEKVSYQHEDDFLNIDDLLSSSLHMEFAFYDMNGDTIPELLTRFAGNGNTYIFSCLDGGLSLRWTDDYWSGISSILENGDILHSSYNAYFTYISFDKEFNPVKEVFFGKSDMDQADVWKGYYFEEERNLSLKEWEEKTDQYLSVEVAQIEWQNYVEWINTRNTVIYNKWKQLEPARIINGKSLYINDTDDILGYREITTSMYEVEKEESGKKLAIYSAGVLTDFKVFKLGVTQHGPLTDVYVDFYVKEELLALEALTPYSLITIGGHIPRKYTKSIDADYGISFTDSLNIRRSYVITSATAIDENYIRLEDIELSPPPSPDNYAAIGGTRLVVENNNERRPHYQLAGKDGTYHEIICFPNSGLMIAGKENEKTAFDHLLLSDYIFYDSTDQFMSRLVKNAEGDEYILLEIWRSQGERSDVRLLYFSIDESGFCLEHFAEYSYCYYSYGGMTLDGESSDFEELKQYDVIQDTEFTSGE